MSVFLKRTVVFLLLACAGAMSGRLSAQTYSGYLRIIEGDSTGPDSLYVTITVPGSGQTVDLYGDLSMIAAAEKASRKSASDEKYSHRPYYSTPWMAGIKTNLVSDLISIPYAGVEIQLARKLSLDLNGWYSKWNIFYPNPQTRIYGGAPELRLWLGEEMMKKGHFIGLHGMAAWYTLEWKDKDGTNVIFQNGKDDYRDAGSTTPAWSCGVTYGYSLPLDRKGRLGFEFYIGLGYSYYQQKRIVPEDKIYSHQVNSQVGITKAGVNLAYRFSLRRVKGR